MPGYYKSKEVYKQHRNDAYTPNIYPVRGLYVTGTHTEPVYQDHDVTLIGVTSSSLGYVELIETDKNLPTDHAFTVVGFDLSDDINVVVYNTSSANLPTDHAFTVVGFDLSHDINVVEYGNVTEQLPTDHAFTVVGFDLSMDLNQKQRISSYVDVGYNNCMTITNITSNAIVITDE